LHERGDALVSLAVLFGLGPGRAAEFGGGGDVASVLDQVEGFPVGLDGRGLDGLGGDILPAGLLELVEAALGFRGFPAEADGTAAEAENAGQR
jgi:hypothetical protein